ncbi:hypothetical protein BC940DRAFT_150597 [Gongronella butleri]|nr:hypothetical protein BC940DRAFT_150597 [Gongronella butleri]
MATDTLMIGNGIKKRVIQTGTGTSVNLADRVKVHYEGYVDSSGECFDSTRALDAPLEFIVGEGKVLPSFDKAIQSMHVGEHAEIWIDGNHAYGKQGRPPTIPANAALRFDVTLLSASQSENSPAKILDSVMTLKATGNVLYQDGQVSDALKQYDKAKTLAYKFVGGSPEQQRQLDDTLVSIMANMAACCLKAQDWPQCIIHCEAVLEKDPAHVKSYYRLGQAHLQTKAFEDAMQSVQRGLKCAPSDPSLLALSAQIDRRRAEWNSSNKKKFKSLFG